MRENFAKTEFIKERTPLLVELAVDSSKRRDSDIALRRALGQRGWPPWPPKVLLAATGEK
jgi:hypothetical protein